MEDASRRGPSADSCRTPNPILEHPSRAVVPAVSSAFEPCVGKWLAGIQEITDPKKGLGTVRADAKLVGDQLQEARMHDYRLFVNGSEVPL